MQSWLSPFDVPYLNLHIVVQIPVIWTQPTIRHFDFTVNKIYVEIKKTVIEFLKKWNLFQDLRSKDWFYKIFHSWRSTVYSISQFAHRLNTIIDSNRIGVISDGIMIEFDSPKEKRKINIDNFSTWCHQRVKIEFWLKLLLKNLLSDRASTFYGIVLDSKERSSLMEQAGVSGIEWVIYMRHTIIPRTNSSWSSWNDHHGPGSSWSSWNDHHGPGSSWSSWDEPLMLSAEHSHHDKLSLITTMAITTMTIRLQLASFSHFHYF